MWVRNVVSGEMKNLSEEKFENRDPNKWVLVTEYEPSGAPAEDTPPAVVVKPTKGATPPADQTPPSV